MHSWSQLKIWELRSKTPENSQITNKTYDLEGPTKSCLCSLFDLKSYLNIVKFGSCLHSELSDFFSHPQLIVPKKPEVPWKASVAVTLKAHLTCSCKTALMTAVFLEQLRDNWECIGRQSVGNLNSVSSTKNSNFKLTIMTCGEKGYAQIWTRLGSSETIPAKFVLLCCQKCEI